jgi:hypothetical protein
MKRVIAGLALGAILGAGGAMAGVRALIVPPGSRVTLQTGRQTSLLTLGALDLSCTYGNLTGAFGVEPAGSPMLFCSRKSVPGSLKPTAPQSRLILVSRFRYYVTDNHGTVVYQVNRAP